MACAGRPVRAALYLRVSTTDQDTERQERELRAVAVARGYEVVEVYRDQGISGSKGREKRPDFDRLHKDATRHRFEIVMAWSVDRLGRSLKDLITFLQHLHDAGVELFLFQQAIDTTTPSGRAMFQMLGVFSEFERAMIVELVRAENPRAIIWRRRSLPITGRFASHFCGSFSNLALKVGYLG
jgi:DNA invertase Pin-like site-specific DNA recombinase